MQALKNAWSLIERFGLVYMVGTMVAMLAPIFLNFRAPTALAQVVVVALAAFLGWRAFVKRHGRSPDAAEWLVALFACVAVLVAMQLFLGLKLSPEKSHTLQRALTVIGTIAFALLYVLRGSAGTAKQEPVARGRSVESKLTPRVAVTSHRKIPLSIGFTNLGADPALEVQRQADVRALSPLFERMLAPEPGKVPAAAVLMVYATLNSDGTIAGMPHPVGVRQLVQVTKAHIVVLANDNDSEAVHAAIQLPGPKTANIVFTLARNGQRMPRFLASLFSEMARGTDMMTAWVTICPQGPASAQEDLPATLFVAEGGKIAFPPVG